MTVAPVGGTRKPTTLIHGRTQSHNDPLRAAARHVTRRPSRRPAPRIAFTRLSPRNRPPRLKHGHIRTTAV